MGLARPAYATLTAPKRHQAARGVIQGAESWRLHVSDLWHAFDDAEGTFLGVDVQSR